MMDKTAGVDHQPDRAPDIVLLVAGRKGVMAIDPGLLKQARETAGLTQAQLAERVGVQKNAVSSWETGTRRPEPNFLPALLKALDVPVDGIVQPGTVWTLKLLREVAGLSHDGMARLVPGMSRKTWAEIEAGGRDIRRHELAPIARALHLTAHTDRLLAAARGEGDYLVAQVRLDPDVVARVEAVRTEGESYNDVFRRFLPPAQG